MGMLKNNVLHLIAILMLIFATNNQNKVNELNSILNGVIEVKSLKEAGIEIDIPEPHNTLEENAREKSNTIFKLTDKNCFSEDTGLEIDSLNGEPGVKSARYAEGETDYKNNIEKVLKKMNGIQNRSAQFKTIISLILEEKEYQFEGICKGQITVSENGTNGFGYDAIFIPEGSDKTFAEMSLDEKNKFSHRKKAVAQLLYFLKNKSWQE